jgi:PAS domain S-box-containing protein
MSRPSSPALVARQTLSLQSDAMFRLLVETVRDYAIFMLDPEGNVATWNAGAARAKGYKADEIIGRHFSVFYPTEDVARGKCEYELAVARREGRFEDEGWRLRKDGTRFWANVVITAVFDPDGNLIGYAKVTRDLTERKKNEEERAARLAAEEANRAKDEFLAMLGHELRNPLAPIVTAIQLMRLRGESGATRELHVIERQVRHMMRLVDDLLDVARIARGKIELRRERIDVRGAVVKAIETATPLLEQRNHVLATDIASHEIVVEMDEMRIAQALTNLITNAAKYTEPGGHIGVAVREHDGFAEIEVSDDGAGIDPALLPHVFELFVQGPQTAERGMGGLGLGLTLVRTLVELHGGHVEAHSTGMARGSQFIVSLPISEQPTPRDSATRMAALRPAMRPRKILLVDDNEDARILLADVLSSLGHQVESAPSGVAALECVRMYAPDVAILDIGLPEMDGYQLAAELRAALPGKPPRLIALTGYGQPSDRSRSARAGFDHPLVKPVDLRKLLEAIDGGRQAALS